MEDNAHPTSVDIGYPITMLERDGFVELQIPDLLLIVRSADLTSAIRLLLERKTALLEWAQKLGLVEELPKPSPPRPMLVMSLPSPTA
jgi:hypothetical protein